MTSHVKKGNESRQKNGVFYQKHENLHTVKAYKNIKTAFFSLNIIFPNMSLRELSCPFEVLVTFISYPTLEPCLVSVTPRTMGIYSGKNTNVDEMLYY